MCKTFNQFVISEGDASSLAVTNRDSKLFFTVKEGFSSRRFSVSDLDALKELHSFLGSYIKSASERNLETAKDTALDTPATDAIPVFSRVI